MAQEMSTTTSLGHFLLFLIILGSGVSVGGRRRSSSLGTRYIYLNIIVSLQKTQKNLKKNLLIAQTMRPASFGPVFIVADFPKLCWSWSSFGVVRYTIYIPKYNS